MHDATIHNNDADPFTVFSFMDTSLTLDKGQPFVPVPAPSGPNPSVYTLTNLNMNFTGALSASTIIDGAGGVTFGGTNSFDAVNGTSYYGFRINETTPLYGWFNVTHTESNGSGAGSVNGWAYNSTGAAITAGQTSAVPEPASFAALFGLMSFALVSTRRRGRTN
ncbi:MAG: hypothetical protein SynsKO_01500 [Synoicihabitans sp.]